MALKVSIINSMTNAQDTGIMAYANDLLDGNSGVVGTNDYLVTQSSPTGMSVATATGSAYVYVSSKTSYYRCVLDALVVSTIAANSSGSTRIDLICLKFDTTATPDASATNVASIVVVQGTPGGGVPATPANHYKLAEVTVANGAVSISTANCIDKRRVINLNTGVPAVTPFDHIVSGCVFSGDAYASTLNGSMTSGVACINGKRINVPVVTANAFTASKDTYVDISDSGNGTAVFTYTPVTNNAASPALAANSIRVAIIVTGAGNIAAATSINQGQEDRILPIASSIAYSVTDSLGNLICPRDPNRKILGYRRILSNITTTSSTYVAMTGLSAPVIPATGRKLKIMLGVQNSADNTPGNGYNLAIFEGATLAALTTQVGGVQVTQPANSINYGESPQALAIRTPSASPIFYTAAMKEQGGQTLTIVADATDPAFILIEHA